MWVKKDELRTLRTKGSIVRLKNAGSMFRDLKVFFLKKKKQILEYIKLRIIVGEIYIRKSKLICLSYQKKKSLNDQSHAQFNYHALE